MKTTFLISIVLYFFSFSNLFSQSNLKFSQTFTCRKSNHINIDISNPNLVIKSVKGSIIVVEASVEISSNNYRLLEFLTNNGRYNLKFDITEDDKLITISDKNNKDKIKIKGITIGEKISYTLYIPENKEIQNNSIVASL